MNKYEEEYKRQLNILRKNHINAEKNLKNAMNKYYEIKNSDIDKKETRLGIALNNINRKRKVLENITNKMEYIRPANKEDIEKRLNIYTYYPRLINETVSSNIPLRFHGTSIYNAKNIIYSGEISSSVDRIGYETSYDAPGQISVTMKETIGITINSYVDLTDFYLPAGCIFALIPKDEVDSKAGYSLLMGNINFKEEPDRLYGIISTDENRERLLFWAEQNNISLNKIYSFDSFIESLKEDKDRRL